MFPYDLHYRTMWWSFHSHTAHCSQCHHLFGMAEMIYREMCYRVSIKRQIDGYASKLQLVWQVWYCCAFNHNIIDFTGIYIYPTPTLQHSLFRRESCKKCYLKLALQILAGLLLSEPLLSSKPLSYPQTENGMANILHVRTKQLQRIKRTCGTCSDSEGWCSPSIP